MNNTNTVHTTAYTLTGWRVNIVVEAGATADELAAVARTANELVAALESVSLTASAPDGTIQSEQIHTVVRREHRKNGNATPVIDFYPEWRGSFGQYKYAHMYLNTPEDIAEFEAQSGLKLDNIPLYDSKVALQREQGNKHPKETQVKTKFSIHKLKTHEDENGKPRYEYSYAMRKLTNANASDEGHWYDDNANRVKFDMALVNKGVSHEDALEILELERFQDYAGTGREALTAIDEGIQAAG